MGERGIRPAPARPGPHCRAAVAEPGVHAVTLEAACAAAPVRSLAGAPVARPISRKLAALAGSSGPGARRAVWIALLAPFLFPVLWTGYAYSGFGLSLANAEFWSSAGSASLAHWAARHDW